MSPVRPVALVMLWPVIATGLGIALQQAADTMNTAQTLQNLGIKLHKNLIMRGAI